MTPRWYFAGFALVLIVLCGVGGVVGWRTFHARRASLPPMPAAFASVMPQRVVWAWEEPEDLRSLPASVGVAYLAETLILGDRVTMLPRRQMMVPAADSAVMAVVRIETRGGFVDSPELRADVARRLATLRMPDGVRALQIDFDATASQREFYAGMLRLLRPQMRAGMPLSMTALVSWCGAGSWLHGLPVDEAVPMFFRMGGVRRMAMVERREYGLQEPLCRGGVGVSTDERWPDGVDRVNDVRRIYVFAPRPWQQTELAAFADGTDAGLRRRQ